MTDLATNVLYDGENLDILRRSLPETRVNLVSLDPPSTPTATTTSSSATSRAAPPMPSCWPSRTPGTHSPSAEATYRLGVTP